MVMIDEQTRGHKKEIVISVINILYRTSIYNQMAFTFLASVVFFDIWNFFSPFSSWRVFTSVLLTCALSSVFFPVFHVLRYIYENTFMFGFLSAMGISIFLEFITRPLLDLENLFSFTLSIFGGAVGVMLIYYGVLEYKKVHKC